LSSKGLKKTTNNIIIKNKTLHAKNINLHCAHHPNQKAHQNDKNIALLFRNTIDIKT
jgi:hypothetical protein